MKLVMQGLIVKQPTMQDQCPLVQDQGQLVQDQGPLVQKVVKKIKIK